MPDNPYYTTEKWKNFKKKQIFYQQEDGIPVYLKRSAAYNSLYILTGILTLICGYGAITKMLGKLLYQHFIVILSSYLIYILFYFFIKTIIFRWTRFPKKEAGLSMI